MGQQYSWSESGSQTPLPGNPTVNVTTYQASGPNFLVRLLWFLVLGLWLGSIATALGYVLCLTIIGLPLGLVLLNRLPSIMTLRPASTTMQVTYGADGTVISTGMHAEQHSFLVRALYFLLIGWWLCGLWLALAWAFTAIWPVTLGLSLAPAFWMFDRVPQVLTLRVN